MHYMFCVSGFSGTGKDEFCRRLVEKHDAVHTGLADPAKRHMADIYGFTRDQLFGPSHMRNAGDPRYPKTIVTMAGGRPVQPDEALPQGAEGKGWWCVDLEPENLRAIAAIANDMTVVWDGSDTTVMLGATLIPSQRLEGRNIRIFVQDNDPRFFLSPREALQKYCDLMNQMYLCTWVRAGVDLHRKLALLEDTIVYDNQVSRPVFTYDRMVGLMRNNPGIGCRRQATRDVVTCFSDFRHKHEIRHVREIESALREGEHGNFKAVLIRVKRPGVEKPPFNHRSETEQATIPDSEFDYVVDNNDTIEQLHAVVDTIVSQVKGASK